MKWLARLVFDFLFSNVACQRPPDFIVGTEQDPYLLRWWLLGGKPDPNKPGKRISRNVLGFRPYLHCFMRSDDDRALHDHPAASVSLCLQGECLEQTIRYGGTHRREPIRAGMVRFRSRRFTHRLEISQGIHCWTLFLFCSAGRDWWFHCPDKGRVHWKDFLDPDNTGLSGKGCDQ